MTRLDPNHGDNIIIIDNIQGDGTDESEDIRVGVAQKQVHDSVIRRYGKILCL